MKKTLNINLGGMAFIIDENAFQALYTYLETLKKKFNNDAEREEIMNDIEARIAEMLSQKLGGRKEVISMEDVDYVIGLMGKPEDIAGDDDATAHNTTTSEATANTTAAQQPVKKRLFRDPDDAKIGGVIAGLCHYFGINDPVWLRIAAIILIFFTSGTVILLYLLLVIVIPKANTSAEKLQMKGEPVNISTIEKEVKDAANRFSVTVSSTVSSGGFFEKLWQLVVAVVQVVFKMAAAFAAGLAVFGLIIVSVVFFVLFVFGTTQFTDAALLLVDKASTISLFSVGFLLFFAAPLIAIIYLGLKALLGRRSQVLWLKWVLLGAWVIGLVLLLITGINTAGNFKEGVVKKDTYTLMQPAGNTLLVQLADSSAGKWTSMRYNDNDDEHDPTSIVINGKELKDMNTVPIGEPDIELIVSENDSFYIRQVITARGISKTDALKNANMVTYAFGQTDSVLNLRDYFEIPKKGGKYRAQKVKIQIAVPKGKHVRFGSNIDDLSAVVKGDNNYDYTPFANTSWTLDETGKVKCLNCETENDLQDMEDSIEAATEKISDKMEKDARLLEKKLERIEKRYNEKQQEKDKSNQDF